MLWGSIATGLLSLAGKVLPGAAGQFFQTKRATKELQYEYKRAVLHERSGSWKDEYILLVFTVQFPTFLVGFLLDPIIIYFFGSPLFQPAAAQYVFLLTEQLGVEGYRIAVAGCFSLAGVKIGTQAVAQTKKATAQARVEEQQIVAAAKKKKKIQMPPAWNSRR